MDFDYRPRIIIDQNGVYVVQINPGYKFADNINKVVDYLKKVKP